MLAVVPALGRGSPRVLAFGEGRRLRGKRLEDLRRRNAHSSKTLTTSHIMEANHDEPKPCRAGPDTLLLAMHSDAFPCILARNDEIKKGHS